MDIVSVYNDKGGVGKTAIALELAVATASAGKRVLLVDNDPQGSLSTSVSASVATVKEGMDKVYGGEAQLVDVITTTHVENLFIAPAGLKLKNVYLNTKNAIIADMVMYMRTDSDFVDLFDIVIFDNAPTQDGVALYCTLAADRLVIPVIPDNICYDALVRTYIYIEAQCRDFLDKYVVIVPSMVMNRAIHKKTLSLITEAYHGRNDNTVVSDVRVGNRSEIPESIGSRQNLFISHASSESAAQFKMLCTDVFPWMNKDDFLKTLDQAAEEKKRAIREKFKQMVEARKNLTKTGEN
jgi:chromosome partitioning protein